MLLRWMAPHWVVVIHCAAQSRSSALRFSETCCRTSRRSPRESHLGELCPRPWVIAPLLGSHLLSILAAHEGSERDEGERAAHPVKMMTGSPPATAGRPYGISLVEPLCRPDVSSRPDASYGDDDSEPTGTSSRDVLGISPGASEARRLACLKMNSGASATPSRVTGRICCAWMRNATAMA
jgi:hypothetical protein